MIRVLYVDDEPDLLELGKVFLETTGQFSIDTIESASGALSLLRQTNYDAIIADYQMPGMDGIAFLKAVRASGNDIPFILFTGRGREEIVIQALNEGADFYLQKGGDPTAQFTELASKIRQAVSRRNAEQALKDSERRQSDIINFLPDATFAIDRSGTVIAWNRAIEDMTGVPAKDMLGRGNYEYALPFYHARQKILIDLIFEPDEIISQNYSQIDHRRDILIAETALPRPKGRAVTLLGKASPLYDRKGGIVGAIESIRDITDLRTYEKELTRAKRDWETIFRAIGHPTVILDSQNRIIEANDAVLTVTGKTLEDLKGRRCFEVFHGPGSDAPPDRCPFEVLKRNGSPGTADIEIEALNGYYAINCTPVFDADGHLDRVIHIAWDVTDRRRAQDELRSAYEQIAAAEEELRHQYDSLALSEQRSRESERRFRELADLLPQGVYEADRDGHLRYANRRAHEMFGYTDDDLANGLNILDVIAPEDQPRVAGALHQLTGHGIPSSGSIEYRMLRKDGSTFPAAVYSALIYQDERIAGIRGILVDISDREQMIDALRESEEKYRAIIENIQDMVYRADTEGRLTMVNPAGARMLGFSNPGEMIGMMTPDFFLRPDDWIPFLDAIRRKGSVYGYTLTLKSRDGKILHVTASSHLWYDTRGKCQGVEGILHDITDLQKVTGALALANKKLTLLSGITRHDIQNQLQALDGYLALSERALDQPERIQELIGKERRISRTIARQIGFTREYGELGANAAVWQDVSDLVRRAQTALPMENIQVDLGCTGVEIFADPLAAKVFYNLIDNSLRHGGKTMTTIAITAQKETGGLRIIYQDDGIGIKEADRRRLFTKANDVDSGLGLFLSREILAITGITITETGEPGKGARFEISVPQGAWRFTYDGDSHD